MLPFRKSLSTALLMAADAFALFLAAWLAVQIRAEFDPFFPFESYWALLPLLAVFVAVYASAGLYSPFSLSPPEEFRRLAYGTLIGVVVSAAIVFLLKEGESYSRGVFVLTFFIGVLLIPTIRSLTRVLFARLPWWGMPVAVVGDATTLDLAKQRLLEARRAGLVVAETYPLTISDEDTDDPKALYQTLLQGIRARKNIETAFLFTEKLPADVSRMLLEHLLTKFPRVVVVPAFAGGLSLWVSAREYAGYLGLEIRHSLLSKPSALLKRAVDLFVVGVMAPVLLIITLLLALAIRVDSPGPVFFSHRRIGKSGQAIRVWKFRTMVKDAEPVLQSYLQTHPQIREEWEREHKLKDDPRITRIGRFLRRSSLDELPQLWNVFRGDMSLVGPRPVTARELEKYDYRAEIYKRVLPGITGMWQVSGRNLLSYQQRIELDEYYVLNWSPWLDAYILLKTLWVVIHGRGAI